MTSILVMGVCGSGKTTVGKLIARRLNFEYVEGDDFHPPENKAKMAEGIPLDDRDRLPWLEILRNQIADGKCVVACSALKKTYRDILRSDGKKLQIVHLEGSRDLLFERLRRRKGHFMPKELLNSQLATIERPHNEGHIFNANVADDPNKIVDDFLIHKVLTFWFEESSPSDWFSKSDEYDQTIKNNFSQLHDDVSSGKYPDWRTSAEGCLAEIIVLDQMSRNMFREDARAHASDSQALECTLYMIQNGLDRELSRIMRSMAYMPLQHSENLEHQNKSVEYFVELDEQVEDVHEHRAIIQRFGRFPHRNKYLGRISTQEEIHFLDHEFTPF